MDYIFETFKVLLCTLSFETLSCHSLEKSKQYNPLEFEPFVFLRRKKKGDQNDERIFILTLYVYEEKEGLNETAILHQACKVILLLNIPK